MSVHFHPLVIKEIRRETADCVSISFFVPDELKPTFVFKQGQTLTLRTHIDGREVRRSYSICSSPLDNELRIAVKQVEDGIFSTHANTTLQPGHEIEVMPPMGKFYTELLPTQKKNYVAFAAGSGITPIISIIKTTLLTEAHSSFTLIFGNRNRQSIIFKEALEALKNKFIGRLSIIHILSREKMDSPINFGRIDAEKCRTIFSKSIDPNTVDAFFLCGPEEMIFTVKDFLEARNIPANNIHFELFNAGAITRSRAQQAKPYNAAETTSNITITLDGSSFDFNLRFNGESILDAAMQQGADLPFACKGGVCCTCRARLIAGEVDMDVNYGLEPEEIEQGFILTCQAHPRTEKVIIDFDVK